MLLVHLHSSFHLSLRRKLVLNALSFASAIYFNSLTFASASDPFRDAFLIDRYDRKTLILSSDVVKALELAKREAENRHVPMKRISKFAVSFSAETYLVSLSPPYAGGFDGPEFRVEIRRSDLKILSVVDDLGMK
jgi:hypothetical protein